MGKRITTKSYIKYIKDNLPDHYIYYDYTLVNYTGLSNKIKIICPKHGEFLQRAGDHRRGSGCPKCGNEKRKETLLKKYGVDNFFKRVDKIQDAMKKKYGVKNPGLMPDHLEKIKKTNLEKYGVEWAAGAPEVKEHRKMTNLIKYGFEYPMQNKSVAMKMVETKVKYGLFAKSNSSEVATKYIREYIKNKGYALEQCAYNDIEHSLYEWGLYYKGKWRLFDLVVFQKGYRGNKHKIIEILEYNGPFHYREIDVNGRENEPAYPWKTNKTTIAESIYNDKIKSELGKKLTPNFTIIWEDKL